MEFERETEENKLLINVTFCEIIFLQLREENFLQANI